MHHASSSLGYVGARGGRAAARGQPRSRASQAVCSARGQLRVAQSVAAPTRTAGCAGAEAAGLGLLHAATYYSHYLLLGLGLLHAAGSGSTPAAGAAAQSSGSSGVVAASRPKQPGSRSSETAAHRDPREARDRRDGRRRERLHGVPGGALLRPSS